MRVLGAARLSRAADESTSVVRQVALIEAYVNNGGHTLVDIARDEDVSGAVSPFERPGLGPWLERHDEWDVLVVPKIDRLSRSQLHVHQLIEWARDHGKVIHSLDIGADITDRLAGGVVVAVLASVAEAEREQIRERTKASFERIVRDGRWRGGTPPYGYKPEPIPGGGYRLVIHEPQAAIVRGAVRDLLAGKNLHAIVRDLNKEGVPSPGGSGWRRTAMARLLKSQTILGRMVLDSKANPTVLYDESGPIQRAEPLISLAEWAKVQDILGQPTERRGKKRSPLYGVAYCECGMPLTTSTSGPQRAKANYYRCTSGRDGAGERCRRGKMIRVDELTQATYDAFLKALGPLEMTETITIPGEDHTAELEDVRAHLERLQQDRLDGLYDGPARDLYVTTFKRLTGRLEALEQAPTTQDRTVTRTLEVTYAEHWSTLTTDDERNEQLRQARVRVITTRDPAADHRPDGLEPEYQGDGVTTYHLGDDTLVARPIHDHALFLFPVDALMTLLERRG